jgi:hypothetical protein
MAWKAALFSESRTNHKETCKITYLLNAIISSYAQWIGMTHFHERAGWYEKELVDYKRCLNYSPNWFSVGLLVHLKHRGEVIQSPSPSPSPSSFVYKTKRNNSCFSVTDHY